MGALGIPLFIKIILSALIVAWFVMAALTIIGMLITLVAVCVFLRNDCE